MKFITTDNETHVIDPASVKRISGGEQPGGGGIITFAFYGETRPKSLLVTSNAILHIMLDYEVYLKLNRYSKKD